VDLQNIFYAMAIVFMSIMFIFMIVAIAAILTIKRRITEIHRNIEDKLRAVNTAFQTGEAIVEKAKHIFGRDR